MASTYALPHSYGSGGGHNDRHAPSWTSNNASRTRMYQHFSKNSIGSNSSQTSLHPDDALEEGDEFNPNGLYNGHTRTHSFNNGSHSPLKSSFSRTRAAAADVPSPVMEEDMPTFGSHPTNNLPQTHMQNHSHDYAHSHSDSHSHNHSKHTHNHSNSHSQPHAHTQANGHAHTHHSPPTMASSPSR